MKQFYLLICLLFNVIPSAIAQELPEITTESLFTGYSPWTRSPSEIRFVNGFENNRIWKYEEVIIQQFQDSIKNPEKIKFVSVSYNTAEELKEAIRSLSIFPNLEYLEIVTAPEFKKEHVKKELVLPEDLSGIKQIKFLNIVGSYEIEFRSFFNQLKKLPELEYFSFGHHLEDVVLPEDFVELKNLKGFSFNGFKSLILPPEMSRMSNLSSVILYMKGFNDVSAELEKLSGLPNLTDLSLRYVDFDKEKYAALAQMEELETLELVNSNFENLQELFDLLPEKSNLKSLRLINLTTEESPKDYSSLRSLEQLEIQNMPQSEFRLSEDFYSLVNLKRLRIYEAAGMENVSSGMGNLLNLTHLSLYNNNIESLPPEIGNLKKLQVLDLRGNNLVSLTPEIGNFINLKILELTENNLVHLPEEMENLTSLEEIRAEDNDLKSLPQNIGNLRKLKTLGLNQNQIEQLPESITQLKNLTNLGLSENDLKSLPRQIGDLTQIEEMPLGGNFLIELPESFTRLTKLKTLDVSDNNLQKLPENLDNLKALEQIFAGNTGNRNITHYTAGGLVVDTTRKPRGKNVFKTLPGSLSRLTNLKHLHFAELENIDSENFFNVLFNLESRRYKLDLSSTGISVLPEDGWENFYVEELILGRNIIPEVPKDIINAPYLNYLSLRRSREDQLGYSYRGEEQLKAFFEEEGFISLDQLPRTSAMAEAYLQNAYTKKYSGATGEMLSLMKKAFFLDSTHTAKSIRKDTYAEALMEGEAYKEAIEFFTKAIQRDTARGPRILNFIIPQFRNRATAYLAVGDTLSAIQDLRFVSERFGSNDWGDAALLARSINNEDLAEELFQKGIEDYQRRIKWNEENDRVDFAYHLSLLELYIIAEKTSEAQAYLVELKQKDITPPQNEMLLQYFDLVLEILSNEEASSKIKNFKGSGEISGWSFELFKKWIAQADIPPQKKQKIIALTAELENRE